MYAIPGTPAYAPTNEHVMEAVTLYQLRVKTVCQRTVFLLAYTGTVQELNGLCRLPAGDPAASFRLRRLVKYHVNDVERR